MDLDPPHGLVWHGVPAPNLTTFPRAPVLRRYDNVVRPPSTARVCPVMNVDSCERRKREA